MLSCDYLHSMMRGDEGNYSIENRHLLSSRNMLTMFCSGIFQNVENWKEIMFAPKRIILISNSNTGLGDRRLLPFHGKSKKRGKVNPEWHHFPSSVTPFTILDFLFL